MSRSGFRLPPRDWTGICLLQAAALAAVAAFSSACQAPWERTPGPRDRNDLPIRVSQVRGAVYAAEDFNYWKNNTAFYVDQSGIFFFDAGWSHRSAGAAIWKSATASVADFQSVLLTSYPVDRSGGLWEFRRHGIPIIMSADTSRLIRRYWQPMQEQMAHTFSSWPQTPEAELPSQLFQGRMKLLGGRIEVIQLPPSVAPDASVVLFVEERVLYGGALLGEPLLWTRLADAEGAQRALDTIAALDWDLAICGHGRAVQDREVLTRMRQVFRQLPTLNRE
ncbi:MAG: hypothetical protein K1X75_11635 [Leptospirales bacterium]|nr:hypothetical protein [Leptospirales bacterium]